MARKKLKNKNVRKLSKTGVTTMYVTLPKEIISKLGWRAKQKVVIKQRGKGILITDWKK